MLLLVDLSMCMFFVSNFNNAESSNIQLLPYYILFSLRVRFLAGAYNLKNFICQYFKRFKILRYSNFFLFITKIKQKVYNF